MRAAPDGTTVAVTCHTVTGPPARCARTPAGGAVPDPGRRGPRPSFHDDTGATATTATTLPGVPAVRESFPAPTEKEAHHAP